LICRYFTDWRALARFGSLFHGSIERANDKNYMT